MGPLKAFRSIMIRRSTQIGERVEEKLVERQHVVQKSMNATYEGKDLLQRSLLDNVNINSGFEDLRSSYNKVQFVDYPTSTEAFTLPKPKRKNSLTGSVYTNETYSPVKKRNNDQEDLVEYDSVQMISNLVPGNSSTKKLPGW